MSIAPKKLKVALEMLKQDLGGGLVATDIWSTGDSKSVSLGPDDSKPLKTIALLNEVTGKLGKTLKGADFPGLGSYYFINLANNRLVVVLAIGAYQQYILVDLSKTSMGILMSIALPNLLGNLIEAKVEVEPAMAASIKTSLDINIERRDQPRKKSVNRDFLEEFSTEMFYRNQGL